MDRFLREHAGQSGRKDHRDHGHPHGTADQDLRRPSRHHRARPRRRRGRDLRLPRAQRGGQDDDDAHPARPHPADLRAGRGLRHRDDRRPGRHPPPRRLPARRVRPLRPADRRRDDRLLREPARRRRSRPTRPSSSSASTSTRAAGSRSTRRATSRRSGSSSRSSTGPTCSSSTSRRPASTRSSSRPSSRSSARPGRGPDGLPVSSHIIDEVDRTCDRVAIIREGRLVQVDRIEAIRRLAFHHVELRFAAPVAPAVFESLDGRQRGRAPRAPTVRMRVNGPIGAVIAAAAPHDLVDVVSREPNLEDVFLAQYGGQASCRPGRRCALTRRPWPRRARCRGRGSWACARSSPRPSATAGVRRSSSGSSAACSCSPRPPRTARSSRRAESRAQLVAPDDGPAAPSSAACSASRSTSTRSVAGLSWRVGNILPVMLGLWSVLALSGTLAGEAARGSLDLLAVDAGRAGARSPSRRSPGTSRRSPSRCCSWPLVTWLAGPAFADLPGDAIRHSTAALRVRAPDRAPDARLRRGRVRGGAVRRADTRRSPSACSSCSAAIVISSYGSPVAAHRRPRAAVLVRLDRRPPAARRRDGLAVGRPAGRGRRSGLLAVGVVGFERRDIGASTALAWLRLPVAAGGRARPVHPPAVRPGRRRDRLGRRHRRLRGAHRGVRRGNSPRRSVSCRRSRTDLIRPLPGHRPHPAVRAPPAGVLRFGSLLLGLAGATRSPAGPSDETERRLDVVLSAPISRGALVPGQLEPRRPRWRSPSPPRSSAPSSPSPSRPPAARSAMSSWARSSSGWPPAAFASRRPGGRRPRPLVPRRAGARRCSPSPRSCSTCSARRSTSRRRSSTCRSFKHLGQPMAGRSTTRVGRAVALIVGVLRSAVGSVARIGRCGRRARRRHARTGNVRGWTPSIIALVASVGRPARRLERPAQDGRRPAPGGDGRDAGGDRRHRADRDRRLVARRARRPCRSRGSSSGVVVGRRRGGLLHPAVGGLPPRRPVGRLPDRPRHRAAAGRRHRGRPPRRAAGRRRLHRGRAAARRVPAAPAARGRCCAATAGIDPADRRSPSRPA